MYGGRLGGYALKTFIPMEAHDMKLLIAREILCQFCANSRLGKARETAGIVRRPVLTC